MTSRTLIVMRHGHAATDSPTGDRGRPLTDRGHQAARATGRALAQSHPRVDVVLCSTATRTRETWAEVSNELNAGQVRELDALYGASVDTVLDLLAEVDDDARSVMLVGHNPTVSELVRYLGGRGDFTGAMSPANAVVFESESAWNERRAGSWRAVARVP
jgi:phosphohistidine phosphatase